MNRILFLLFIVVGIYIFNSCKQQVVEESDQQILATVKTSKIKIGNIEDHILFNGKTICLKKNKIQSPITGYIMHVNVNRGDRVKKNDVLFELETKENKALKTSGASGKGTIKVMALSDGFINEVNIFEIGGYVLEGDNLCTIAESNDLLIQVNVPFEYSSLLKDDLECNIILPDQTHIKGSIYKILPIVNESDQTQPIWLKPNNTTYNKNIPENLNLLVDLIWKMSENTKLIPKTALMTNETQSVFWVMKIAENNLAIKIPVQKGIQSDSMVEIISNELKKDDLLISEGAYGLPDSTQVNIEK